MTFNEIKKLLQDSGEEGILFELPKFRSNERLYLNKNGEIFHAFYGNAEMKSTELMPDEELDNNWMPRGWDEEAKPILKSHATNQEKAEKVSTDGSMTVNDLYEFVKTWEPTPEQVRKMVEAVQEFEKELEEKERRTRVDDTLLNKRYNM